MWNEIAKPRIIWLAVLAFAIFYLLTLIFDRGMLMMLINATTMSLATTISVAYMPAWISVLFKPGFRLEGEEALSLGIGCCWVSEIGQRIYSGAWYTLDAPTWLTTTYLLPALLYLNILGGTQHVTAPGIINGVVPRRNWVRLGVAIGVGLFIFSLALIAEYNPMRAY